MGFFNRLLWVFGSPIRLMAEIKEGRAPWWQAWIWVSLIAIFFGYLSIPINMAVMELNLGGLPPDELDAQIAMLEGAGSWVLIGLVPVGALLLSLIAAAIGYILVAVFSERANFKQFFTLTFYSWIIYTVGGLISTLILRMKGPETIRALSDTKVSIGLGFLAPEEGALVRAVVTSFDFFVIWSLVLVVMGLMHIFEMTRRQAIICVIPLWVLYVGMLLLGEVTGSL